MAAGGAKPSLWLSTIERTRGVNNEPWCDTSIAHSSVVIFWPNKPVGGFSDHPTTLDESVSATIYGRAKLRRGGQRA